MRVLDAPAVDASAPLALAADCAPGVGAIITTPDARSLIDGVHIAPLQVFPDDRGYFLEVFRAGHGLAAAFSSATTQLSATLSYPGAIKAFHYHRHQYDCWMPVAGMFQVVLVDLRADSPSFSAKNTLYLGALRPWQVLIPPGVAHGYKVIGNDPAVLVYVTSRFYNAADEGRIPYNDPGINYDWTVQHK